MKASKSFNPDPLLGAFASGLACKGLTPFVVKWILETEGFYEPERLRIEELPELLRRNAVGYISTLYDATGAAVERATLQAEPTSHQKDLLTAWQDLQEPWKALIQHMTRVKLIPKPKVKDVYRAWQAQMEHLKTPAMQRALCKMVLEGNCSIVSPLDPAIAEDLAHLRAYERLTKLEHPELNVPSLENLQKRVIQSIRKPSHRPSTGKDGERFRTAAVVAAILLREARTSPRDSWKRVADHLNRADVPRPKGASFKAKTIENWCSKGTYSQNLYKGMISLAKASPFRVRTRAQVAECALIVAVHFGNAATKKLLKCSC
jgi:hypothetical protein